jgi:hypothetical protein
MVRKVNILLILIAFLFVFSGCPEFYTFNLFDGLDYVKLPSPEDLSEKSTDEGLDYLDESISSDSFIDKIAEDPEAQGVVTDYLQGIIDDPDATEDQKVQAAVLAADFQLGVNGSNELIENVFNIMTSMQDLQSGTGSGEDQATLQGVLTGIMPAAVTELGTPEEQEEAFSDIVVGLLTANNLYETLGDVLISDPAAGNPDVTGGTLVNAAVAGMLDIFVTEMVDLDNDGLPDVDPDPAAAAAVLWDVYQAGLDGETDLSGIAGFNETAEITTSVTDLTYLQNIATTAGIDAATLFGTPV